MTRDRSALVEELASEAGLSREEALFYLQLLKEGSTPAEPARPEASRLLKSGMAIVSGDGTRVIPVHPRLGVANQYRTWREAMVKEMTDRRMRVDRLILELIPMYEAATEKRTEGRGG